MRIYTSFGEFLNDLGLRLTGPMWVRFILQPLVAIILGVRDGINDARAGRPPYIWGLFFHPGGRRETLTRSAETLAKPIIIATVLDAIAQYLMFRAIYPGAAVLVGVTVMALPYTLARALANRVASSRRQRETAA